MLSIRIELYLCDGFWTMLINFSTLIENNNYGDRSFTERNNNFLKEIMCSVVGNK